MDGAPVGMARVVVEDGPAHLYSMWVAPEARGGGVGAHLITTGLDWLAAHHPGRTRASRWSRPTSPRVASTPARLRRRRAEPRGRGRDRHGARSRSVDSPP
ncbi:GNAT family N-acetyltransferase [Brachybacterium sp. GPGPB12]|uniref:GNAT family N-acetyltransferase n=1 Tax=Brachybacterium sp. GPGPB12 TaxID=3023517 RepID=UPI0031344472